MFTLRLAYLQFMCVVRCGFLDVLIGDEDEDYELTMAYEQIVIELEYSFYCHSMIIFCVLPNLNPTSYGCDGLRFLHSCTT